MNSKTLMMVALLAVPLVSAASGVHSSYVGQETREIKAYAPEFIEGLRVGAGLGFAKSAELNGYPGPAHLLELSQDIPLSGAQADAISRLQDKMRMDSIAIGERLIAAERTLEQAFRAGAIDAPTLDRLTQTAGVIRAELRAAHLSAHIMATALLTDHQIARYQVLRGYVSGNAAQGGGGHGAPNTHGGQLNHGGGGHKHVH